MSQRAAKGLLLAALPAAAYGLAWPALAHSGESQVPTWSQWVSDPLVLLPLVLSAAAYAGGVRRLWSAAAVGSGIRRWQASAFMAGWLVIALALVSPLDPLAEIFFSAHMVQHGLMMLVGAPLLVLGSPLPAFLWALPPAWRRTAGRLAHRRWWRAGWRLLRWPVVAWGLYAVVLWAWHAPVLYEAALGAYWLHALQHVTFLGAALLLWWVAFDPRGHAARGVAVLAMFTTALHSSILGALMTFASSPWYASYRGHGTGLALTVLEDQQLAGLIMWVPGGLIHLLAGMALMAMLIRGSALQARLAYRGTLVE